jgi:hypothetical protein
MVGDVSVPFLPAAEVVKQEPEKKLTVQDDLYNNNSLLPSPMLSPHVSLSSDDETEVNEPLSPPDLPGFQLDDFMDWHGQQTV